MCVLVWQNNKYPGYIQWPVTKNYVMHILITAANHDIVLPDCSKSEM